jgi:hypothetical protein
MIEEPDSRTSGREPQPRLTPAAPRGENRPGHAAGHLSVKLLTTLAVARELNVSKQTLLNWLYAKKVPEPPRDRNGHRLWSPVRVRLVRQLIREGRLHQRTVVHRETPGDPSGVRELAEEVSQLLRDAGVPLRRFVRELNRAKRRRRPRDGAKRKRR